MAWQFGSALRTTMASDIQAAGGATAALKIFSGAVPANCAAADPAGLLVTIALPPTFLTAAGGVASLAGSWTAAASGAGNAATVRLYDSGGVCLAQGSVSATGGAGDLTLDNVNIAAGQTVTITAATFTIGGA